jgi:hypothetical protein
MQQGSKMVYPAVLKIFTPLVHPAGLPIGRLTARPRELNITFRSGYNDNRTANLTTNYGKETGKRTKKRKLKSNRQPAM